MLSDKPLKQILDDYHQVENAAMQLAKNYCAQNDYPYYHIAILGLRVEEFTFKRCFGSGYEQIHCVSYAVAACK